MERRDFIKKGLMALGFCYALPFVPLVTPVNEEYVIITGGVNDIIIDNWCKNNIFTPINPYEILGVDKIYVDDILLRKYKINQK